MPTSEQSAETGNQSQSEKRPSFAELQKQKEALFKEQSTVPAT